MCIRDRDRKKNVIEVIEVSKKEVDEAKKLKVTPGKLTLIKKLQEAANEVHRGHEIDQDEWRHESVQEINAKIREMCIRDRIKICNSLQIFFYVDLFR